MASDPRLRSRPTANNITQPTNTPPPPPPPPTSDPNLNSNTESSLYSSNNRDNTEGPSNSNDFKLKFCTVCASNNNRSMEGHLRLAASNYPVISFGTGSMVRLPGPSITQPNTYHFNISSYDSMFRELESKDPRLYRANGILNMLERNRSVKWGPERWQDWRIGESRLSHDTDKGSRGAEGGVVDIVITCEERCWDAVVDDLLNRASPLNRPVHIFNIDIKDSHEEALVGGKAIVDLADSLNRLAIEERNTKGTKGWEDGFGAGRQSFDSKVPDILADWQERWPQFPALWTCGWF